jgi:F-type H+-transporting ATPase subunit alpha
VGGKAQIGAMKSVSGGMRLDLASFRELEAFAQLGTELDKATQSQLDRGYRVVEVLKQPPYQPVAVVDQVIIIYAATKGFLDKIDRQKVQAWEAQFIRFMREQKSEVRSELEKQKKLTPELTKQLEACIQEFGLQFRA